MLVRLNNLFGKIFLIIFVIAAGNIAHSDENKLEFISGPFTNLIFSILEENKNTIKALIGKYKMSVSKEENFFRPV